MRSIGTHCARSTRRGWKWSGNAGGHAHPCAEAGNKSQQRNRAKRNVVHRSVITDLYAMPICVFIVQCLQYQFLPVFKSYQVDVNPVQTTHSHLMPVELTPVPTFNSNYPMCSDKTEEASEKVGETSFKTNWWLMCWELLTVMSTQSGSFKAYLCFCLLLNCKHSTF